MIHTPGGEWGYRMRHYKVNKINHTVFDTIDEVPSDIQYREDWRDGHITDWVKADDGCIIQILRQGTMMKPKGKVRQVKYIVLVQAPLLCQRIQRWIPLKGLIYILLEVI